MAQLYCGRKPIKKCKFSGNENKFVKNFKEKNFEFANKSGKINVNSSLLKNLIVNSNIGSVYLLDVRLIWILRALKIIN